MTNSYYKTPIVFQAMPKWDHPYASTALNMAKRVSKKRKVFYVEHPYTWKDIITGNKAAINKRLELWNPFKKPYHIPFAEYPNLIYIVPKPHLPINFLPEGELFEYLRNGISKAIWKTVDKTLDKFGIEEFIYFNSFDPIWSKIRTRKKVLGKFYQSVDNIEGESYIARHGSKAEKTAVMNAQAVITTSAELKKKFKFYNHNIYKVENGVDYNHFDSKNQIAIPVDLAAIKGIKLLYVGNIGIRIDYQLIEKITSNFPQLNWVFVGPEDSREFRGENLKKKSNVHFLGRRSYDEIPAYIMHADICMLPFKCNELTKCIYPLKINEYFACGKPVLATPFSDLSFFDNQVQFFHDEASFKKQVEFALKQTSEDINRKKETAKGNDWNERVLQIEKIIKLHTLYKSKQSIEETKYARA
ncbi:MAG: glycosyltransferase [Bacteroidota bacterium]